MKIAVIGSGYVGLPLAIAFSKHFEVVCFDINKKRIQQLKNGIDLNRQHSKKEIIQKKLTYVCEPSLLEYVNVFIITVPTPINKSNKPNLSLLKAASLLVGKYIKKNSTVIYESTTYPGCTEQFCIPILEKVSKLKFNNDFNVAYSPERVNPGDKVNKLKNITKIVGANDPKTLKITKNLYKKIVKSIYEAKKIKIAESAKVIENIQRDINIALVNELSVLLNKLKIPTNDVLKAAASKWNFHYYKPGLVGGHCISVDPYYLAYEAKNNNYIPKLILSGRRFNENMGKYLSVQVLKLLIKNKIDLSKSRIAILGFSFKENIPDFRNTKIIQIIKHFKKSNIKIDIFDPLVSKQDVKKKYNLVINNFSALKKHKYDAIILAVSHKEFLKEIHFFNKFYKNKNKKIFVDLKNNYKSDDLEKNRYIFFQM
jgi:UDP-N-acetyl-D-galactosamine dehydrogenase